MQQEWAVLGGGLLGMTLALRLRQAGHEVSLIEAAPELGGLASAWKIGDLEWDRHYHVTLLSDSYTRDLLRETGLESEMVWKQTRTGFYSGGRHHSMSSSLDFLLFPPLGLAGKARLALTILHASRIPDYRELENTLVEDWLVKWSGRSTFEKIWKPLLRAKLGDGYRRTSAAFIWATIARLYAARRSGMKREMFGYLPGGYGRTLAALETRLREAGVRIRVGTPVRRVEALDGGLRVSFDGAVERFDRAVCTMPSPVAAKIAGLASHQKLDYQGIVCASVLLNRPLSPYYVTNITDTWVPFTGVIDMSALVDPAEFGGHGLVYLPKYVAPDDPLFEQSDAEIEASFLGAIERMYPEFRRADVRAFRVSRVRHVFPVPVLGYSKLVPPVKTEVPGLYCVNSTHIVNGTLNVNQTLELAEQAARQLLAERSSRREVAA